MNWLKKMNAVDTSKLVNKTDYKVKIKNIEDKIPGITILATNAALTAKINDVKDEIPNISGLATTAALTAVKEKIPNVSDLVQKPDYEAKIKDIEGKYFSTSDYKKFTNNILDAKITEQNLVNESDIANFLKDTSFYEKLKNIKKK